MQTSLQHTTTTLLLLLTLLHTHHLQISAQTISIFQNTPGFDFTTACALPLQTADTNSDSLLTPTEYATFVQLQSNGEIVESYDALPPVFQTTFQELGCRICGITYGLGSSAAEQVCCRVDDALDIATVYADVIVGQRRKYLFEICTWTNRQIEDVLTPSNSPSITSSDQPSVPPSNPLEGVDLTVVSVFELQNTEGKDAMAIRETEAETFIILDAFEEVVTVAVDSVNEDLVAGVLVRGLQLGLRGGGRRLVGEVFQEEVRIAEIVDTACPPTSPPTASCQRITGETDVRIIDISPPTARTALENSIQESLANSARLRAIGFIGFDVLPVPTPAPVGVPTVTERAPTDEVVPLGTGGGMLSGTIVGIGTAAAAIVVISGVALFLANRKKRKHVEDLFSDHSVGREEGFVYVSNTGSRQLIEGDNLSACLSSADDSSSSSGTQHVLRQRLTTAIDGADWSSALATAQQLADTNSTVGSNPTILSGSTKISYDTHKSSDGHTIDWERYHELDRLVSEEDWDGVFRATAEYEREALAQNDHQSETGVSTQGSISIATGGDSISTGWSSGISSSSTASTKEPQLLAPESVEDEEYATIDLNGPNAALSLASTMDDPLGPSRDHGLDNFQECPVSELGSDMGSVAPQSVASSSGTNSLFSTISAILMESPESVQKRAEYRSQVEELVRRVLPAEIQYVDEMMRQFRDREDELLNNLRSMEARSVAQLQREEMRRNAKKQARKSMKSGKGVQGVGGGDLARSLHGQAGKKEIVRGRRLGLPPPSPTMGPTMGGKKNAGPDATVIVGVGVGDTTHRATSITSSNSTVDTLKASSKPSPDNDIKPECAIEEQTKEESTAPDFSLLTDSSDDSTQLSMHSSDPQILQHQYTPSIGSKTTPGEEIPNRSIEEQTKEESTAPDFSLLTDSSDDSTQLSMHSSDPQILQHQSTPSIAKKFTPGEEIPNRSIEEQTKEESTTSNFSLLTDSSDDELERIINGKGFRH